MLLICCVICVLPTHKRLLRSASSNQRHETYTTDLMSKKLVFASLYSHQHLVVFTLNRSHNKCSISHLFSPRMGNRRAASSSNDAIKGCRICFSTLPVGERQRRRHQIQSLKCIFRTFIQSRYDFYGVYLKPHFNQNRSLITATGTDFEDSTPFREVSKLRSHQGNHVRLTDGLPEANRLGGIIVRDSMHLLWEKMVSGNRAHGCNRFLTGDSTPSDLLIDHNVVKFCQIFIAGIWVNISLSPHGPQLIPRAPTS